MNNKPFPAPRLGAFARMGVLLGLGLGQALAQTAPVITRQPVSQTNLVGAAVSFSVRVSGAGPFAYQWRFNGTNLPNDIIGTVAGDGSADFSGDGGAAPNAALGYPAGVAVDAAGNLFIADQDNNRIRKVDLNGIITTVAGNGASGFSGDGGLATNASLGSPSGVAVDGSGNLFIADEGNHRIRKVDPSGIISTIAGNGTRGYSADGGAATNSRLNLPYGVTVDAAGNVFVADTGNHRIRKVDSHGVITTVAGNGTGGFAGDGGTATAASLQSPTAVAVDGGGRIFIADYGNNRIRQVDAHGTITTVAGNGAYAYAGDGGPATAASLANPQGVAVDAAGNLFIADLFNQVCREVNPGGVISTVAGNGNGGYSGDNGPAAASSLLSPAAVATDAAGNLYIADSGNGRIRAVALRGNPVLTLPSISPADGGNYQVVISNSHGSVTSSIVSLTVALPPSIATQPVGATVNAGGTTQLGVVATGSTPLAFQWLKNGAPLSNGGAVSGSQTATLGLTNVFGRDGGGYSVVTTNLYGSVTSQVAVLIVSDPVIQTQPAGQSVPPGGNAAFHVGVIGTAPLTYQWRFGGTNITGATNAAFSLDHATTDQGGTYDVVVGSPFGSAISAGAILQVGSLPLITRQPVGLTNLPGASVTLGVNVAGPGPFSYQWQFNGTNLPNNLITTVAGKGGFGGALGDGGPATNANLANVQDVAVDAAGNLFIADTFNSRIRKVDLNGIITTVAGKSPDGFSGDGGAATNARLALPTALSFDGNGNLYIADGENNRIRKVDGDGIITTVAGTGTGGFAGDGGAATNARLRSPAGVVADGNGNLFIADQGNNRIRKVDSDGNITTVVGNGTSGFAGDGGPAADAKVNNPAAIALDAAGNLYIADYGNQRIRKVDGHGVITTAVGTGVLGFTGDGGAATNARLSFPTALAFDPGGNLVIADQNNNRIRKVNAGGIITTIAGKGTGTSLGDGGAATNANLSRPRGLAFDAAGNLFISDAGNGRIRKVGFGGNPTLTITNLSAATAGGYRVIVGNTYGSVTSAIVTLSLQIPDALPPLTISVNSGQIQLQATGSPGAGYVLETASSLTPPILWQPAYTNAADAAGVWNFTDPNPPGDTSRFYRLASP